MPDYSVFVEDTVQCAFYQELDTRLILNSLTFKHNGGPPVLADTQLLVQQLADYWQLRIQPLLSDQNRFDFAIVVPLNFDFSLIWGSTTTPSFGGIGGGVLPNNVGFRMEFETTHIGRSYRGWNTVTGLSRTIVFRSTINAGWAANMLAQYVGFGPLANALGWEWVVTSTHVDSAPRAVGITTPITRVYYKDLVVDSTRHRLPGRRF